MTKSDLVGLVWEEFDLIQKFYLVLYEYFGSRLVRSNWKHRREVDSSTRYNFVPQHFLD